jgi:hypothetical protein
MTEIGFGKLGASGRCNRSSSARPDVRIAEAIAETEMIGTDSPCRQLL